MTAQKRSGLQRLFGAVALLLFAIFAGNILLAKAEAVAGFSAPLLPPVAEFLILLAATFTGVLFLLQEESRQGPRETP